jgi:cell division protein FtsB
MEKVKAEQELEMLKKEVNILNEKIDLLSNKRSILQVRLKRTREVLKRK